MLVILLIPMFYLLFIQQYAAHFCCSAKGESRGGDRLKGTPAGGQSKRLFESSSIGLG